MYAVRGYHDIAKAIEDVPPEGRLFCFFAFDERPSHRVVLNFLEDSREWLDHQSADSGIFTLVFVQKRFISDDSNHNWQSSQLLQQRSLQQRFHISEKLSNVVWTERIYIKMVRFIYSLGRMFSNTEIDEKIALVNPTIELARQFGVPPSKLPGLFVFESLESQQDLSAAYIPLKPNNFVNLNATETTISAIYSCISETLAKFGKNDHPLWREMLIDNLQATLNLETDRLQPKSRSDIAEFLRDAIDTGGGAYIAGNVNVYGSFIGRDQSTTNSENRKAENESTEGKPQ